MALCAGRVLAQWVVALGITRTHAMLRSNRRHEWRRMQPAQSLWPLAMGVQSGPQLLLVQAPLVAMQAWGIQAENKGIITRMRGPSPSLGNSARIAAGLFDQVLLRGTSKSAKRFPRSTSCSPGSAAPTIAAGTG